MAEQYSILPLDGRKVPMNFRRLAVLVALVCAGMLLWSPTVIRKHRSVRHEQTHNGIEGFQVGQLAPDFQLLSLDGTRVKLSEVRGRPVLLNFWATWCAPCRVEMPWLVAIDQKYRAQGLQVIGVSMDDSGETRKIAAFAKERAVKYPVLLGNASTADAYGGVRFMPQSFFIDPEGKIAKATVGLTHRKDLEDGAEALLSSHHP